MGWALLFALLATTGAFVGKGLQKQGIADLPAFSLRPAILLLYLKNPSWRWGMLLDIGGAFLTLGALALAPVSVVQPLLASGLILLVLYSRFVLKEEIRPLEWFSVGLLLAGTIGIAASLQQAQAVLLPWRGLLWIAATFVLLGILEALARRGFQIEICAGLQSGFLFALSAAWMRMLFLLSSQAQSPWIIALGLPIGILLTGGGFALQTRGLKEGRAVILVTVTTVSAILYAIATGTWVLQEPWPSETSLLVSRLSGLALILLGIPGLSKRQA